MAEIPVATADLVDKYGAELRVCETQFRQFGGRRAFAGPVRTVYSYEDNGLLRELVRTPGEGCVLVVDGGGSLRRALVGDMLAGAALANGWAALARLDLGIMALGTNPRPSEKARAGAVDVPVTFGGVTFRPGDILHADGDGIVLMPRSAETS